MRALMMRSTHLTHSIALCLGQALRWVLVDRFLSSQAVSSLEIPPAH
jgi:hypothetical protein